jgi:hypothetical protein
MNRHFAVMSGKLVAQFRAAIPNNAQHSDTVIV